MKKIILLPRLQLLLLSTAFVFVLSACSDDDDGTPSQTDILTSTKWQANRLDVTLTGSVFNIPVIEQSGDFLDSLDACQRDDLFVFNTNGTLTIEDGTIACPSIDDPDTDNGTWTLSADGQTLTMSAFDFSDEEAIADLGLLQGPIAFTVTSLTESRLELFYEESTTQTIEGTPTTIDLAMDITFVPAQ